MILRAAYDIAVNFFKPLRIFSLLWISCCIICTIICHTIDKEKREHFNAFWIQFQFLIEMLFDSCAYLLPFHFICMDCTQRLPYT